MRRRTRLVWRLFGLFTVIVCGTLVAAGWYFSHERSTPSSKTRWRTISPRARASCRPWSPRTSPP